MSFMPIMSACSPFVCTNSNLETRLLLTMTTNNTDNQHVFKKTFHFHDKLSLQFPSTRASLS